MCSPNSLHILHVFLHDLASYLYNLMIFLRLNALIWLRIFTLEKRSNFANLCLNCKIGRHWSSKLKVIWQPFCKKKQKKPQYIVVLVTFSTTISWVTTAYPKKLRALDKDEVTGSNPVSSSTKTPKIGVFSHFLAIFLGFCNHTQNIGCQALAVNLIYKCYIFTSVCHLFWKENIPFFSSEKRSK